MAWSPERVLRVSAPGVGLGSLAGLGCLTLSLVLSGSPSPICAMGALAREVEGQLGLPRGQGSWNLGSEPLLCPPPPARSTLPSAPPPAPSPTLQLSLGGRCLELPHPPQPPPISTALQPTEEAEGSLCECGSWTSPCLPLSEMSSPSPEKRDPGRVGAVKQERGLEADGGLRGP